MTPGTGRRVALIGAYERDNFGDLLFLLQTEAYLVEHGLDVVATSAFEADMRPLLGRHVPAFHRVLADEHVDHIWTVGGEVGGATMATAFGGLGVPVPARGAAGRRQLAATIRQRSGATPSTPAYVARPTAFPANALASLTLNSVGLSGVAAVPARERLVHLAALRESDSLVVRDAASSAFLAQEGIDHRVAPDLMHSVALTRPRVRRRSDVVLVQAAERWIRAVGAERVARALVTASGLSGARLRLFLAGTAPGHDSAEAYAAVVRHVRAQAPDVDIEPCGGSRDPWHLVDVIGDARLWIGQSLHGRIVASAYGVPRISLADPKLDTYAATWDAGMPAGVTTASLDEAVSAALAPDALRRDLGAGRRLGMLADASIREAIATMLLRAPGERAQARLASVERLRRDQLAALEDLAGHRVQEGVRSAARRSSDELGRRGRALALRVRSSPSAGGAHGSRRRP